MSAAGDAAGGPPEPEELLVVLAAAVHAARGLGLRRPVVTAVAPAAIGPRVWALAGRLDAVQAGRRAQRQTHSAR